MSDGNSEGDCTPVDTEKLRAEANDLFKKGCYSEAIGQYLSLLNHETDSKKRAICYANSSFASCKLEHYGRAMELAESAIQEDPQYVKAYYRRAAAYTALNKHKAALEDLKKVAKLQEETNNPDRFIYAKIKECEKLIHRIAFERAISVENKREKPLAFTIDCDSIPVGDDYVGPRLKDHKQVTLEFVEQLIKHFEHLRVLHRRYVLEILRQSYKYFAAQPTLVDISIQDQKKFTVVGDIHGQFFDLLNIFKINGMPSEENPYLFNGDIVDRGSFSIECIILLLSMKLLYPDNFFISRGNHETHTMNSMYGFQGECQHKYTSQIYEFFSQVFQVLPLAHHLTGYTAEGKKQTSILVMHGGLFSQDDVSLDDIRAIDRDRQPPGEGLMCELLWSDPMPSPGRANSKRGIAIAFGPDVTAKFCERNNINFIIRSHEVKALGYEVAHRGQCLTVFSAPNYCDTMGNLGAIIRMKGPTLTPAFETFAASPHPGLKPMAYANHLLNMI